MRRKLEVGANAWRAQLLSLLQQRGQAQKALALFTPEASASVRTAGALTASPLALKLLSSAVESRRSEWSQVLAVERDPKRQRVSDGSKNDAVFAAKLAQSIVKTYASTSAAAVKEAELEDLVVALDLACVALYVACALEHAVRLGDLVVDNLLYQVAKKYAEIPSMRVAASCVAACIHVRLWNAHATVCKASGGDIAKRSQLMVLLDQDDDCTSRVMQQFELVAAFPDPMGYHSEQFTRLLLGHVNTCVTLLVADKNPEAVLIVADSTLSRWIDHLQKLPGQNSKLASSFSDRTFRILWKCAAVADGAKQKSAETASTALRFRSTALTFLLKCSNYTALYFIQQVHRVGVQHERVTNRSQRGLQEVYAFYAREANDLSQAVPDAPHMYTSESLQWEYLNWIEHFTSITDLSGMHLRSAMILESAVHYVELFGSTGTSIQACLLFSIAGALFNAADSTKGRVCLSSESGRASAAFAERLIFCTGKLVRELAHNTESSKWHDQCEKAARVHLNKLEALTPYSFVELGSRDHVLFLMRCIKRSSTKIFNYAIGVQDSQKNQLYKQVVTCFGNICKAVRELRSSATLTDIKAIETLILEESRLHRMAVMLSTSPINQILIWEVYTDGVV
ncbi:hypothetical protein PF011_g400 [Phytophthora fragariae]|uniref:Uncharacterized protein n=1 Tax=Phytophthora fragariae TaxID=53985 RepID=A0A6A3MH34_9STRA|nr:hypothetical protein PF011_g400 [Phytophthora fragariae]